MVDMVGSSKHSSVGTTGSSLAASDLINTFKTRNLSTGSGTYVRPRASTAVTVTVTSVSLHSLTGWIYNLTTLAAGDAGPTTGAGNGALTGGPHRSTIFLKECHVTTGKVTLKHTRHLGVHRGTGTGNAGDGGTRKSTG